MAIELGDGKQASTAYEEAVAVAEQLATAAQTTWIVNSRFFPASACLGMRSPSIRRPRYGVEPRWYFPSRTKPRSAF